MNQKQLANELVRKGALKTPAIIGVFERVDRADFVPEKYKDTAYLDKPIPLARAQTISQPTTVAMMLEWLAPQKGDNILDVGSGSGWTTALLAQIVGPRGRVFGVEIVPELVEFGRKNIEKYDLKNARIETPTPGVETGGGVKTGSMSGVGLPEYAPYNKILASAAADSLPKELVKQLKNGGRMVVPIGGSVWVVNKSKDGIIKKTEHPGFAFVPLIVNN